MREIIQVARRLFQVACVLAFAIGAGLFAYGSFRQGQLDPPNPLEVTRFHDQSYNSQEERQKASICRGVGIGFMTFGALGLVVPWVNACLTRPRLPVAAAAPNETPAV